MTPIRAALTAALLAATPPALADSTAGCHCFRDRTFEPARPGAADAYILATTRSSLLSASFGVPKRSLVTAVMTGTAPEDLWIAHYAAAKIGRSPDDLLAARGAAGSWPEALAGAGPFGARFASALARGAPAGDLAAIAVDETLLERAHVSPGVLREIRGAGAGTEETVVATVLAARLGAPVAPLVAEVKAGRATWGGLLHDAGIEPRELDALVRGMVR